MAIVENSKIVRIHIHDVLDNNCKGCLIYRKNLKNTSVSEAGNYCLFECEVGKELKRMGDRLLYYSFWERMV